MLILYCIRFVAHTRQGYSWLAKYTLEYNGGTRVERNKRKNISPIKITFAV